MLPSEVPRLATDTPVRVFPGVWKLLSFLRLPPWRDLCPYLFRLSFYLLYFFLSPLEDNEMPFWVPDVLCQHSEYTHHSNVLSMNLWGRKWSPHSIPLPS